MVDVWWGICERAGPGVYDFRAYKTLFHKIAATGLKIQAVMSFHTAGANVGDTCHVPLPPWVHEVGKTNPDIYYTDRAGNRNRECLSIGCDYETLFYGRSPLEMYEGLMRAFVDKFQHLFGALHLCTVPPLHAHATNNHKNEKGKENFVDNFQQLRCASSPSPFLHCLSFSHAREIKIQQWRMGFDKFQHLFGITRICAPSPLLFLSLALACALLTPSQLAAPATSK